MAQLTLLRTMLHAADLQATVAFYRDALGFELAATFPPGSPDPGWAQVHRDAVWLMFTKNVDHSLAHDGDHVGGPAMTGSVYINTDDVDAYFAEVRDRLSDVEWEPQDFEHGMREFAVRDPNGYLVIFGMSLDRAGRTV